jgi:hypothetical protein
MTPTDLLAEDGELWVLSQGSAIRWSRVAHIRAIGTDSLRFETDNGHCLGYADGLTLIQMLEATAHALDTSYDVLDLDSHNDREETPSE